LNALVESRLVRREPRHKIYFYEIVSEFLVPWIRDKKIARRAQIEANRLAAETKERLKRVERERRYVTIFAIFLGVLLIAAVWLTYLTYRSRQAAVAAQEAALRAQQELQKERDRSKHLIDLLNQLTVDNPKERLAAVNGFRKLNEAASDEEKLPRDLISVIVAVTANDPDKEVSAAASYFYDTLSEIKQVQQSRSALTNSIIQTAEEKNATLTDTQQTVSLPPRVYFQLANENQRARADKIAGALRGAGFTIPAYQIVGDRAPVRNELRWYQPADEADLSSVSANRDKALQTCREVDGTNWIAKEVRTTSTRPNHYELWFGADRPPATPTPTPTPTATPTATPVQDVVLKLSLVNEQGRPIPYRDLQVQLRSTSSGGRPILGTSVVINAPPGIYVLGVRVPGYKTYSEKIVLQGSEVSHQVRMERQPILYKPEK